MCELVSAWSLGLGESVLGNELKCNTREGLFLEIIFSFWVESWRSSSAKVENVCVSAVCGSCVGERKRVLSSAKKRE